MPVPRPKGSADLIADRRRRALALLKSGLSLNEVARRIQCVASSVMRWRDAWRRCGADALKVGSSPGRPLKLKPAQRRRLMKSLSKGPLAHGYNTNVWTTARIAELDPARVWSQLPPRSRWAPDAQSELESPKAREACGRTG